MAVLRGNDGRANHRGGLAGLAGNFLRHCLYKYIEFRTSGCNVRTQDGAIQGICFHIERDAVGDDIGMAFEHMSGNR